MAAPSTTTTKPPTGVFSVWQRLLRGYGPLAVFAILIVLMSLLVPSKVPEKTSSTPGNSTGNTNRPGTNTGGGATTTPGQTVTDPGATGAGAGGGGGGGGGDTSGGGTAVIVAGCDQVPGDPYSPPCTQWDGASNGGATAKGVNETEIHVAFRVLNEKGFQQTLAELAGASLSDTPETVKNTVQGIADYFNKSFQFYGRKIIIDFYNGVGSNTRELVGEGLAEAQSDATHVADDLGSFADMSGTSEPYGGALASKGVVAFGMPYLSRAWHEQYDPYAWSLATDCTTVATQVGKYVAARLQGPAKYAGGDLKDKPRKVLGLAPENEWYAGCIQTFRDTAGAAGVPADQMLYKLDLSTLSTQAPDLVAKAKAGGYTTIVCGCDPIMPVFFSGKAAANGYLPEFVNIGVALDDTDLVGQLWNQQFTAHSFGISALTDSFNQPATSSIGYAAYKSVKSDEPAFSVDLIYAQMHMLATGLQLAGPNLTPFSFRDGMFSYPPRSGPLGLWGYGPGDYTPQDDVREIYWDPNAISPYNNKPGTWKDPNPGQRYQGGNFPQGEPNIPVPP